MTIQQLRATVERDALHAALKRLERCATDDRNTIPILNGVLIESDGAAGVLRLSVTDLDRQAVVTVPGTIDGGGRGVAMLAPMAAIVAKLERGAQVELIGPAAASASDDASRRVTMICHRFRACITGFMADSFPVMAARPAAWSIQMHARPLLALLIDAAKDATPPGAGDSKGVRFTFAADGLTVTAGTGEYMTRRCYPLPRMMAGGLAFKPKEGAAPVSITFTAEAVKALADAIDKPGKNDGDGPAVTIGFAVEAGAVVAAMIDTGGALVTVKADTDSYWNIAALDETPLREWFKVDGDDLSKALESMAKGDNGKANNFALRPIGDSGFDLAPAGGGACSTVAAAMADDLDSLEVIGIPMLAARAAKGGGLVTVSQLAGDLTGRGLIHIARGDGVAVYVAGFTEGAAERFARTYGAAYEARDRAGMVAAVAAYRAALGEANHYQKAQTACLVAIAAAAARGMKPSRSALARGEYRHHYGAGFADWQQRQRTAALLASYEAGVMARGYAIERDNRGKLSLRAVDDGRALRLLRGVKGKECYESTMTEAQAERFRDLYAAGFDGENTGEFVPGARRGRSWSNGYYAWRVIHPDGLAIPKATRAKRAASEAAQEPQEAPAAVLPPEPGPEAASEAESAPVAAMEPDPAPDDVGEGPDSEESPIDDAGEAPAPVDAAPDLAATVAELLARVAALESARPGPVAVADESPAPVAVDPVADATADYWRARAIDAESRAAALIDKRNRTAERMKRARGAVKGARFFARLKQDLQALAENDKRHIAAERDAARADLAAMTAERDALAAELEQFAAWSAETRQRTAARLRAIRATARELEAMHDSAVTRANDATRALAAEQGKVAALGHDLARMKAANPLAGMKWAPGHIGATVTATRGPANPAHPDYQAPVGARAAA